MPINTDLATKIYLRYCWVRDNGHAAYVQKAEKCDAFFRGDQWDPADRKRLEAAESRYRYLMREYPGTENAARARSRLDELAALGFVLGGRDRLFDSGNEFVGLGNRVLGRGRSGMKWGAKQQAGQREVEESHGVNQLQQETLLQVPPPEEFPLKGPSQTRSHLPT